MTIICTLLFVFLLAVFARIVLSWFPIGYDSPLRPVLSILFTVTEPVLGPLRRALPPVRLGGISLDLSPIIVIIGINIINSIIC